MLSLDSQLDLEIPDHFFEDNIPGSEQLDLRNIPIKDYEAFLEDSLDVQNKDRILESALLDSKLENGGIPEEQLEASSCVGDLPQDAVGVEQPAADYESTKSCMTSQSIQMDKDSNVSSPDLGYSSSSSVSSSASSESCDHSQHKLIVLRQSTGVKVSRPNGGDTLCRNITLVTPKLLTGGSACLNQKLSDEVRKQKASARQRSRIRKTKDAFEELRKKLVPYSNFSRCDFLS